MLSRLAETAALVTATAPWLWLAWAMVLGAAVGSFLNCVADRAPRGRSLRHPPSMCDTCGTRLTLPDLIPIVSWLALRGRCRHCGAAVPARNLWLEVASALWPLVGYVFLGASWGWAGLVLLGWLAAGVALAFRPR